MSAAPELASIISADGQRRGSLRLPERKRRSRRRSAHVLRHSLSSQSGALPCRARDGPGCALCPQRRSRRLPARRQADRPRSGDHPPDPYPRRRGGAVRAQRGRLATALRRRPGRGPRLPCPPRHRRQQRGRRLSREADLPSPDPPRLGHLAEAIGLDPESARIDSALGADHEDGTTELRHADIDIRVVPRSFLPDNEISFNRCRNGEPAGKVHLAPIAELLDTAAFARRLASTVGTVGAAPLAVAA